MTTLRSVYLRTPKETADLLRCTTSDLTFLRRLDCGPEFVRIGRAIRYGESEIRSWLKRMYKLSDREAWDYCQKAFLDADRKNHRAGPKGKSQ